MYLDADAHVDECSDTWEYFPKKLADLRPVELNFKEQIGYLNGPKRGLFIDGQIFQQHVRNDELTQTTADTRELRDIPGRLAHMDQLGIDIQVIYPTLLLYETTRRPEVEVAIYQSYNRWVADRCAESGGRIRWTALLPLRSMPEALVEMKRAKDDGAVGIFKKAFECDDRRAGSEYFRPMYELAEELDMPICVHISRPYVGFHNSITKTQIGIISAFYVQDAFTSIVMDGICLEYPRLRFGFIEAGAGWLPYALWMTSFEDRFTNKRAESSLLRSSYERVMDECRLFATCEATENLSEIIGQIGDNSLCIGTDYVHTDRSGFLTAHSELAQRNDISAESARKITSENGRRFYGIPQSGSTSPSSESRE